MAIKGLDQAIDNLSRVRKNAIPAASAMTINRVATTAINQSSSQVARETRVRRKLVKERSRLKRATVRKPTTDIRKDRCSKCMRGCELRRNVGNFGGFLSINKLSQ